MKKRLRKKRITHGRWDTLPSARFIVNRRTGETVSDYEMMALRIPVRRVQAILRGDHA